jgi:putative transposase
MLGNIQNISKDRIEKEIIKTFALFKKQKNISTAEYLKKFDVSIFSTKKYRKIRYSHESLIKLYLFQQIKGIKFYTKTTKYLRRNPSIKWKLGFCKAPDRSTIGYFVNKILDDEIKIYLKFTIDKIIEISEKFGIIFDVKILQPNIPKQKKSKSSIEHKKNNKTKEIGKYIKKRLSSLIDLNLHQKTKYTKKDFIDLLLHMCERNDYAENGGKSFKIKRNKSPNGDTLLYHLKKYNDINHIKRNFTTIFEMIWESARKNNIINIRRKVDIAVDYTEINYYGKKNTPMIRDKKPERGAKYCYKFITIDIVENNKRFTLFALTVGPLDTQEQLLRILLSYAKQRVKIKRLLTDRGFFDSNSIQLFKDYHVPFIMPCSSNNRIKNILETMPAPCVIIDYPMKHTTFNVVIVKDSDKIKRAFATNIYFNENDVNLADRIFMIYSRRWGIETSFRILKHSFKAKTTSKNYFIRLFYFLFSVLLYNLWILIDVLLWLSLFGKPEGFHLITSKYFCSVMIIVDDEGG